MNTNGNGNQPEMIVSDYQARKKQGKVNLVLENQQILFEQPRFDYKGDQIGTDRFETSKAHQLKLKFQAQQQLGMIDAETEHFVAMQDEKKKNITSALDEFDAIIADIDALESEKTKGK